MQTPTPAAKIIGYKVFNRRTGKTTNCKTSAGASRAADRMDNAYGAICCTRRAIWSDMPEANEFLAPGEAPIPVKYQVISATGLILITCHSKEGAAAMLRDNKGCTIRPVRA